jgi:outer membrane protein OmpA-like peptidoglycan-associated protein
MNSVFFDRNSSTLTEEGRQELGENVEVLTECVTINARIEGYAVPGERNPQELSEDRARAVEQFYIDNGILASRLTAMGMGVVEGMTSKKAGAAEARRADTIPVR